MIVRILTARVPPDHAARFNDLLRAKLVDLRDQPGLVYAKLARRFDDLGHEEVVLFEEWRSPSDLWAWTQGRLASARMLPGTEELVEGLVITHYEALDVIPDDLDLSVTWSDPTPHSERQTGGGAGG
ncbi:MAG: antibiotic biosynthesis monooxygenase family protein [Chloroflexota bacterium]